MSETIKVSLEADASQLTNEFKKAQAQAAAFSDSAMPRVGRELGAVEARSKQLAASMAQGKKGTKDFSQGLLQVAQFADDAQYGMRGILNNIPGLVMGFGGGVGLAGALSLATLAGSKLLPVLKDLLAPGQDFEALNKVTDQFEHLRRKSEELAKVRGSAEAMNFVTQLGAEEAAIKRQNEQLAFNVALMKARREASGSVDSARDEFEIARIEADPSLSADQKDAKKLAVQQRQLRRQAQAQLDAINDRVRAAEQAAAEKIGASSRGREDAAALRRKIAEDEARRQSILERVSRADLARDSIPGAQAAVDNFKTPGNLTGTVQERAAKALAAREALQAEVDRLTAASSFGNLARKELAEVEGSLEASRKALAGMVENGAAVAEQARQAAEARDFTRKAAEAEARAVLQTYEIERARLNLPKPPTKEPKKEAPSPAPARVMEPPAAQPATTAPRSGASAVERERGKLIAQSGGYQSKIRNAGGILPASLWGGVGAAGRIGLGAVPASLRGGVAAAGMPGLGPGYRVRRGLSTSAADREMQRNTLPAAQPKNDDAGHLQSIAESNQAILRVFKTLGIL